MFEGHFERRTRSTKQLHNARAKTCGEVHANPFRDSDFVPSSQAARAHIDEKSFENRQKSTKNRFWAILGIRSPFGDAPGRAQDGLEALETRPGDDLGPLWGRQERLGDDQKRLRDGLKTLPNRLGAMSERVWSVERCRPRARNDFSTFFIVACNFRQSAHVRFT